MNGMNSKIEQLFSAWSQYQQKQEQTNLTFEQLSSLNSSLPLRPQAMTIDNFENSTEHYTNSFQSYSKPSEPTINNNNKIDLFFKSLIKSAPTSIPSTTASEKKYNSLENNDNDNNSSESKLKSLLLSLTHPVESASNHNNDNLNVSNYSNCENIIKEFKVPSDILDDLASRFVLNMPQEEKDDPIRICFQIEIAFWFYNDFYCESFPELPCLKLKRFAFLMFNYIPRLRQFLSVFDEVISNWFDYKFSIPCSGAVLLDSTLEYVLLVQGYGSKNWGFPKGKVNHDETLSNCAIREVFEETGYDCTNKICENEYLERKIFESTVRLYIVTGVEMDFDFKPHARNEIRSIQWFLVKDLPIKVQKKIHSANLASKFFAVIPFVFSIRKWIDRERKKQKRELIKQQRRQRKASNETSETDESQRSGFEDQNNSYIINTSSCNSPYTVVENPSDSTSFVDVKLDDILDLPYKQDCQKPQEQSLLGLNVFQAEDTFNNEGIETTISNQFNNSVNQSLVEYQRTSLSNEQSNEIQKTWQLQLDNYTKRNVHSEFANTNNSLTKLFRKAHDLQNLKSDATFVSSESMFASLPNNMGSSATTVNCMNKDSEKPIIGSKLEDIEKSLMTNLPSNKNVSNPININDASSLKLSAFEVFGSKASCDDKLNYLFGLAQNAPSNKNLEGLQTSESHTASSRPTSTLNPLVNTFDHPSNGPSNVNDIFNSNLFPKSSNGSNVIMPTPVQSSVMSSPYQNNGSPFGTIGSGSVFANKSNGESGHFPIFHSSPAKPKPLKLEDLFPNLSVNGQRSGQLNSTSTSPISSSTAPSLSPSPPTVSNVPGSIVFQTKNVEEINRCYNGLDSKQLPVIENKIQQLLQRLCNM